MRIIEPQDVTQPRYASIDGTAKLYGVSRGTIYKMLRTGALSACKLGARTLVDVGSADAYLASQPRAAFGSN